MPTRCRPGIENSQGAPTRSKVQLSASASWLRGQAVGELRQVCPHHRGVIGVGGIVVVPAMQEATQGQPDDVGEPCQDGEHVPRPMRKVA